MRVWVRMKRGKEGERREKEGEREKRGKGERVERKKEWREKKREKERRKSIEAWMLSKSVVQDASGIKTPAESGRYRIRRKNV